MEEQGPQQIENPPIPEGMLYHYTTLDGLLGILKDGVLWATGLSYLSDTSEYQAGLNAVIDLMNRELVETQNDSVVDKYAPLIRQSAESVFTVSFSKETTGDDLSQWRAYGGEHSGVSLGFSFQYLREIGQHFQEDKKDSEWIGAKRDPLVECKYYKDGGYFEHDEEIRKEIEKIVAQKEISTKVCSFARYAATLKHEKFIAEKEWRILLVHAGGIVPDDIKFRRVKSLIVPYICISLVWDGQPIEINRIVVGPTPHNEKAKESIELLLKRNRVKYREVINSSVPFRNW
jgi:hypothetical protein